MRQRLPNRRPIETFKLKVKQITFECSIGFDANGQPMEIFMDGAKPGSQLDLVMADASVAISVALQHGVSGSAMARSIAREPIEIDGPPTAPTSIIGVVLDLLANLESKQRGCKQ